jgi:hypothetical protein
LSYKAMPCGCGEMPVGIDGNDIFKLNEGHRRMILLRPLAGSRWRQSEGINNS